MIRSGAEKSFPVSEAELELEPELAGPGLIPIIRPEFVAPEPEPEFESESEPEIQPELVLLEEEPEPEPEPEPELEPEPEPEPVPEPLLPEPEPEPEPLLSELEPKLELEPEPKPELELELEPEPEPEPELELEPVLPEEELVPEPEPEPEPAPAMAQAGFRTYYDKAKLFKDKGLWPVAARLFEEAASVADNLSDKDRALRAALYSYLKAKNSEKVRETGLAAMALAAESQTQDLDRNEAAL
jgi:hypothetical protein